LWDSWASGALQSEVLDEEVHGPLLQALQSQCVEPFDEITHGPLLQALWRAAIAGEYSRISDQWISLGFQTEDPARDLRGAGALGLRQLLRFCMSGGIGVTRTVTRDRMTMHPATTFPLAAASLNVSLMLCSHFRLVASAGGAGAVAPCSDATLRKLLSFQQTLGMVASTSPLPGTPSSASASSSEAAEPPGVSQLAALDLMHEKLLLRLHDAWAALPPGQPKLMRFPVLLAELRHHLRSTCACTPGAWSLGPSSVLSALRAPSSEHRCTSAGTLLGCGEHGTQTTVGSALSALPTISRFCGLVVMLCGFCSPVAAAAERG